MPFPQPGGESAKIGDRYESIWTVRCLIEVIRSRAQWIEIESLDRSDSEGAEFTLLHDDGTTEIHSVKRQRIGSGWTISALTKCSATQEAIGIQLFKKLRSNSDLKVRFVTADAGSDASPLFGAVRASDSPIALRERLGSNATIRRAFEERVLPIFDGNFSKCFETLKRFTYSPHDQFELEKSVDDQISDYFYRSSGEIAPASVRELLAGFIFDNLGRRLLKNDLLEFLNARGIFEHDFNRDSALFERVIHLNQRYVSELSNIFINGNLIERNEALIVRAALEESEVKKVLVVGLPGGGKSGVLAETAMMLDQQDLPYIAIRLDTLPVVHNTKALGGALGLSEKSPVSILDGMSQGRPSVLLIDQVDAISSASGRNRHAIPVFHDLLQEANRHPNMRVLLACRSFDLSHDASLREIGDLETTSKVEVGQLDRKTLETELDEVGISLDQFDSRQIGLLSSPFNLFLFLAGDYQTNPAFDGVHELYDRFRDAKEREFRDMGLQDGFWSYLHPLTVFLSDNQALDAPKFIFEDEGISNLDLEKIISSGVLIQGENSVRFFHESFFDYSYAKWFFKNKFTLHDLLTDHPQDLFRRSQVRQILVDLRRNRTAQYLTELEGLITGETARPLIKKAIFDWLRSLENPTSAEWSILEPLLFDQSLGGFVRMIPRSNVLWFDVLDEAGSFDTWLQSGSDKFTNYAIWLLSMNEVMLARSKRISEIVAPFFSEDCSEKWQNWFRSLFTFDEVHHSEEAFEMILQMIEWGWFDGCDGYSLPGRDLPKISPEHADRLLLRFLSRRSILFPSDPLDGDAPEMNPSDKFIFDHSSRSPELFVRTTLPWLLTAVVENEVWNDDNHVSDPYANHIDLNEPRGFRDAILHSLRNAMEALAKETPEILDSLTVEIEELPHPTFVRLLFWAWAENGEYFADKAFSYLADDSESRLDVGYVFTGGGNGRAAFTRGILKTCGSFVSQKLWERIEGLILNFVPEYEERRPESRGYSSHILLESLPEHRFSPVAKKRKHELRRKFPNTDLSPPRGITTSFIGSPVEKETIEKMTDGQIEKAMMRYCSDANRRPMEGGLTELSREIKKVAMEQKPRFAKLALNVDESIDHRFLEEILSALVTTQPQNPGESLSEAATQSLSTKEIVPVVLHLHDRSDKPAGRWMCSALAGISKRDDLPDEIFEVVSYYAIHDSDPEVDHWKDDGNGKVPMYGGDPLFEGINTARGSASHTIAKMLFGDPKRYPHFADAIEYLVHDPSTAVRCASIEMLTALINVDRDLAVEKFLTLQEGHPEVLMSPVAFDFLKYVSYSHYESLRTLLLEIIQAPNSGAKKNAALTIAMQSLSNEAAREDILNVLKSGTESRKAAATVFAHNLKGESSRDFCREQLMSLFKDEDPKVREAASHCFTEISDDQFASEGELILAACNEFSLKDAHHSLLRKLKNCKSALPVETLHVAECMVSAEKQRDENSHDRWWLHGLVDPVFNFYAQVNDDGLKSRTLDIVDSMIECGIHGVDDHLGQLDR